MRKGSGKSDSIRKVINPEPTWKAEFPQKEGLYWFYGKRFGNSTLCKDDKPELMVVKVIQNRNKNYTYIADGNFMYKSEPTEYFFQEITLPQLPPNKGDDA